MNTMFGLSKDPVKYEQRAVAYEQKGNTAKAAKNREKAARLRSNATHTAGTTATSGSHASMNPLAMLKNPERYDQKALKWENKGNTTKAMKNREKAARLRAAAAQKNGGLNTAAPLGTTGFSNTGLNQPVGTTGFSNTGFGTTGLTQPVGPNTGFGHTTHIVNAPVVETHVHPTVFEQTTRAERIVEVQPVIHREVEQPTVRVIEKHMYESVPSTQPALVTRPAIVEETVRPRVIEEIQPVVHRNVPAPFVERVEQHVTEHIAKPTVFTKEVLNGGNTTAAPMGMAAGGPAPMGLAAGGPVPISQQTTTTTTTHRL